MVGVGHLCKPGEGYKLGQKIIREESDKILTKNLQWAEKAVEDFVKAESKKRTNFALFQYRSECVSAFIAFEFLNKGNYKAAG